jgi:8-oxo-dGTP pyrophosphatase MutT (NUDIX family)
MYISIQDQLSTSLTNSSLDPLIKKQFSFRLSQENLTRDENPYSHLCVYFAAYDINEKSLFLGKHIKSGLWLFNGGHIDKEESIEEALYREMREEWGFSKEVNIDTPSLFTITPIENPQKQTCKMHFDIWYFISTTQEEFLPQKRLLSREFFEWGWKKVKEAQILATDKATLRGIDKISSLFLL